MTIARRRIVLLALILILSLVSSVFAQPAKVKAAYSVQSFLVTGDLGRV